MVDFIGQQVNRYHIIKELEEGGMATVYLAHDPKFDREVAVKFLPKELTKDPKFRKRFQREAHTIANLEHPAIVPVYDYGEVEGQPYLVMRYMAGGSLKEYLLERGPLSIQRAVQILALLAPALDKAHHQGIVHRDIKPANILFDEDGNPFLSDFGIVKIAGEHTTLTGTQHTVGTPAYMSPEQARAVEELNGRSDIYSLTVVLYEMLTGEQPYQADTPMGMGVAHINDPIPQISAARKDLPPATQTVIDKGLSKDRNHRYASGQELVTDLQSLANAIDSGDAETMDEFLSTPSHDSEIWSSFQTSWKRPALILAVLTGIIILGFSISRFLPNDSTPEREEAEKEQAVSVLKSATLSETSLPITPALAAHKDDQTLAITSTKPEPSNTPKASLTPTPQRYYPLAGCAASRLHVGDLVFVSFGSGENAIRDEPDTHPSDNVITRVGGGERLNIVGGPVCNYGWVLWEVLAPGGVRGWTPETDGNEIWLIPYSSWSACPAAQPSLLHVGDHAILSTFTDAPNRVRENPSSNAAVVDHINPGEEIKVIDGPQCDSGLVWWKVESEKLNLSGWTVEGSRDEYWLLPKK